jgi:hypothetical protein
MIRALLLLPVLLLAGCGGADPAPADAAPGGGPDLKAAYVAQATEVCRAAKTEADALVTPTTAEGFPPFVKRSVALVTKAQAALSALAPPPADQAQLRRKVLDPFAELAGRAAAYGAQVEAAGTDQAKLLPLLTQAPKADGIDLVFLRQYGLGVCADVVEARA